MSNEVYADIVSGEFCDGCHQMTDVLVRFPLPSQHPFSICRECIDKAARLANGDVDVTHLVVPDMPGSATGPKLRFVRDLEGEEQLRAVAESMGMAHGYLRAYTAGDMRVAVGQEPYQGNGLKWHISVSRPDRCPTWDELKQAKYSLLPSDADVEMSLIFPRKSDDYVDIHQFCLHLWEV